ncbi:MAG: hypothetical protein M0021_09610 [Clostridia bacterium]|nr:hypothetical protein [Clostridia bacterium]
MDITIKTKFDKGDKVIVETADGEEESIVFVVGEILGVKQIIMITSDFRKIIYDVKTYRMGKGHSRSLSADETNILTLDDFIKLFERTRN